MKYKLCMKNNTDAELTKQQYDKIVTLLVSENIPQFVKFDGKVIATNMIAECKKVEDDKPRSSRSPVFKPTHEMIEEYETYKNIDSLPAMLSVWPDVLSEINSLNNFMPDLLCITDSLVCLAIDHQFAGFVRDHHTDPIKDTLKEITGRDYQVKIIPNVEG